MHKKFGKTLAVALAAVLLALPLAACGTSGKQAAGSNSATTQSGAKKTVYTTFFPIYDLTKTIAGDKMNIEMIITGNQEPHDFELQASEMGKISEADLIIYNGAGMESFIGDLKETAKDDNKFLDLSEGLTLLKSEDDEEEEHDHSGSEDHDEESEEHEHHHHHHGGINPHTWLSIKNAKMELNAIYEKLSAIDPDNAEYYKKNLDEATAKFDALDKKFQEKISSVPADQRYLIVSHAAFNYLANDYGLKQVAVTGISPEDEPSAQQLATIADFVKQHKVSTIFFEGTATPKVAETLAKNTGVKTASIYTMESVTDEEKDLGYLGLMERNLDMIMKSFDK